MKRVTQEDIIKINEAYLICKTYSGVAKATGWSASTVSKYIIPGYQSQGTQQNVFYAVEPASIEDTIEYLKTHSKLSNVTPEEKTDLRRLQREMLV